LTTALADRLSDYLRSRYPGATVSPVRFLVSGFESEIHTFDLQGANASQEHYVLRLFTGRGAAEKLRREASALSLLQRAGYPVPGLLLQETNLELLGKPFEIIEKLEGQALWPALASANPEQQQRLLSGFGSLLAQLHQLDWRSFTDEPDRYEKNPALLLEEIISHYRSLYTKYNLRGFLQVLDWLEAHKREISVQPAVVHQDFHANNVFLCPDDQLFVIDWTQFAVSDYRIDLCWSLLIMGDFGNPDWGKQIWDAYQSHSSHPVDHMDYFHVIVYMKLLASTVISRKFSPEELGLRPETGQITREQVSIYQQLSQRLQTITGVSIPELEETFEEISGGTHQT
jgi:aminoglycoside phosphotransferase (APT) family kinase protein